MDWTRMAISLFLGAGVAAILAVVDYRMRSGVPMLVWALAVVLVAVLAFWCG